MSACEEWKYNNITESVFKRLKEKLKGLGITIIDNKGIVSFSKSGFSGKIKYSWDEAADVLSITVLDKPFYVSCSIIKGELEKAIDQCLV